MSFTLFDLAFWKDFLANLFSTLLGVIAGVPVAIWVSGLEQRKHEREKKKKVLQLLFGELLQNLTVLSGWRQSKDKTLELLLMDSFLKFELWQSFSGGGELAWIKDPELISDISLAYSMVRHVSRVSDNFEQLQKNQILLQGRPLLYFERAVDEAVFEIRRVLKTITWHRTKRSWWQRHLGYVNLYAS